MALKWDRKLVEILISLYKKYPILYEKKTDGYYDRKQREIAMLSIAAEMSKIRPITIDDVKKKIKTLRSQFSVENVHRYRSLTSGTGNKIFVPKLWCYHLLSFLDKYMQVKDLNCIDKDYSLQTSKNSVSKPLKERNIIMSANTMKRSTKLKESTKNPSNQSEEDVHDAFGKYIASELRAIHEEELLLETKLAIQVFLCIFPWNFIMADDPERDIFPTKEGKNLVHQLILVFYFLNYAHPPFSFEHTVPRSPKNKRNCPIQGLERHISPEKRFGHHPSRTDLEDQFYKFKEENLQLKKAAKKQEEELKRLATKMTRLLREKKSMELTQSP
ncbi:protein fantom, partial [Trichonephila clavata]